MDGPWVEVRNCGSVQEARLLQSVLRGAGIEARIPDEQTHDVQPFFATMLGGVRLLVPLDDGERAAELLEVEASVSLDEPAEER